MWFNRVNANTQWTHDVTTMPPSRRNDAATSFFRRNDVAMSPRRNNDAITTPRAPPWDNWFTMYKSNWLYTRDYVNDT